VTGSSKLWPAQRATACGRNQPVVSGSVSLLVQWMVYRVIDVNVYRKSTGGDQLRPYTLRFCGSSRLRGDYHQ